MDRVYVAGGGVRAETLPTLSSHEDVIQWQLLW